MPDIPDELVEKAALAIGSVLGGDTGKVYDAARAVLAAVWDDRPNAINRWESLDRKPDELAETIRQYAPQTYARILNSNEQRSDSERGEETS